MTDFAGRLRPQRRHPVTAIAVALLAFSATGLAGPPRPIALTGTDGTFGPHMGSGVVFANFYATSLTGASPALNAAGQVAFLGRLMGPGIDSSNDTGAWVYSGGSLRLVARTGSQAPDTDPGVVFSSFYTEPLIDANGHTAFKAVIAGAGVDNYNNDGLWSEGLGALRLVIRENVTPVPGGGGAFEDPDNPGWPTPTLWGGNPMVMNGGQIAQRAFINPAYDWNRYGVWTDPAGTLGYFIRGDHEPVPGQPPWFFFIVGNPVLNASGAIVAPAVRANPPETDRWGVWTNRTGTVTKIIEIGDAVPGLPSAGVHSVDDACINAQGRVALLVECDGLSMVPVPVVLSEVRYGVLQLIAQYAGSAPGTGGANFGYINTPVISENAAAVTAFRARLLTNPPVTEATAKGIWSTIGGSLHLVARSGDPAPGLPGVTYTDFYALAINATGQVAFIAALSDGIGLFRQNPAGSIELVVRDFEPLDVFGDGSDVRLITAVTTPGASGNPYTSASTEDGRRIYFNDNGDLAIRLSFADGSEGIFATTPVPFPPGDMNCDGIVNNQDIDGFILALFNPAGYAAQYPNCNILNGDFTGDGFVNNQDIDGFVAALFGG